MKHMHYLALFAVVISTTALAQSPATTGMKDFALPSARAASPARHAAERGLSRFAAHFAHASSQHQPLGVHSTLRTRVGGLSSKKDQAPQGFPLALTNLGQLGQARLGWGFQVYNVTHAALMSNASLAAGEQPSGIWRYEVIVHGQPVGLVTVARTERGWQMVSVGGAGLAKDINAVVHRYAGKAGTRLRYVRVPAATSDFVQVRQGVADTRFAPLHAARSHLKLQRLKASTASLLDGNALLSRLRHAVARHRAH